MAPSGLPPGMSLSQSLCPAANRVRPGKGAVGMRRTQGPRPVGRGFVFSAAFDRTHARSLTERMRVHEARRGQGAVGADGSAVEMLTPCTRC